MRVPEDIFENVFKYQVIFHAIFIYCNIPSPYPIIIFQAHQIRNLWSVAPQTFCASHNEKPRQVQTSQLPVCSTTELQWVTLVPSSNVHLIPTVLPICDKWGSVMLRSVFRRHQKEEYPQASKRAWHDLYQLSMVPPSMPSISWQDKYKDKDRSIVIIGYRRSL